MNRINYKFFFLFLITIFFKRAYIQILKKSSKILRLKMALLLKFLQKILIPQGKLQKVPLGIFLLVPEMEEQLHQ